jgi:hypothetical protein
MKSEDVENDDYYFIDDDTGMVSENDGVVVVLMGMTKVCRQRENSFAGPFGKWWCLSCWCLGGLPIVFRRSLVSCGTLVVCP